MLIVRLLAELRRNESQCGLHISDQAQIDRSAPPYLFAADIYLHDSSTVRVKLLVREIRPEHQESVCIHHGLIAGTEAEKPRHADIEGIVVFDELLAPHCMDDRSLQLSCHANQLRVCARTARASEDRYLPPSIQNLCESVNFLIAGTNARSWYGKLQTRPRRGCLLQGDVARQDPPRLLYAKLLSVSQSRRCEASVPGGTPIRSSDCTRETEDPGVSLENNRCDLTARNMSRNGKTGTRLRCASYSR